MIAAGTTRQLAEWPELPFDAWAPTMETLHMTLQIIGKVRLALTRPQMFAGVTYSYFVINAAVTTEAFLITRSYLALPVALAVHVIGYFACLREPRIFDLWITKVSRCARTRNWKRWGCNSYAP